MQVGLTRILFVYLFFPSAVLSVTQTSLRNMQAEFFSEELKTVKNIKPSSTNNGSSFSLFKKILMMLPIKRIIALGILVAIFKKFKIGELLKQYLMMLITKEAVNGMLQKCKNLSLEKILGEHFRGSEDQHCKMKSSLAAQAKDEIVEANDKMEQYQQSKPLAHEDNPVGTKLVAGGEDTMAVEIAEGQIPNSEFVGEFLSEQHFAGVPTSSASLENGLLSVLPLEDDLSKTTSAEANSLPNVISVASDSVTKARAVNDDDDDDDDGSIESGLSSTVPVPVNTQPVSSATPTSNVDDVAAPVLPAKFVSKAVTSVPTVDTLKTVVGVESFETNVVNKLVHVPTDLLGRHGCLTGSQEEVAFNCKVQNNEVMPTLTSSKSNWVEEFKESSSQDQVNWQDQFVNFRDSSMMQQVWDCFDHTCDPLLTRLSGPVIARQDDLFLEGDLGGEDDYDTKKGLRGREQFFFGGIDIGAASKGRIDRICNHLIL